MWKVQMTTETNFKKASSCQVPIAITKKYLNLTLAGQEIFHWNV